MYFNIAFCSLIALAAAAPRPQDIDFAAVDAIPDPTYSIVPGLQSEVISYNPTAARSSAAAEITTDPLTERDLTRVKRGACDPEPTVANKYNLGSLSDPASFAADSTISYIASQATAPSGYTQSFVNLAGSSQAYGYMGYYLLDTYSTDLCAAKCNAATGCLAFNICKAIISLVHSRTDSVLQISSVILHLLLMHPRVPTHQLLLLSNVHCGRATYSLIPRQTLDSLVHPSKW